MDTGKLTKLIAKGWKIGTAEEFLGCQCIHFCDQCGDCLDCYSEDYCMHSEDGRHG